MKTNTDVTIRTYQPGDPSLVCYFYYKLFEKQYQFNGSVENYFIRGMAELFDNPEGNQLWVAQKDETIVGCIAIIKREQQEAQLRWFGVDTAIQGMGIGNQLLNTAMEFCKEHHYDDVILWTIDLLKPARHLYGKYGFRMTETKPNNEWADYEILEEKWEFHQLLV